MSIVYCYFLQGNRGNRRIETVRLRRKRYRKNKKKARQQNWEHSIGDSICVRWTKLHEEYLDGVKDAERDQQNKQDEVKQLKQEINVQRRIKEKCEQEIACRQKDLYQHVVDESMQNDSFDALLLPPVTGITSNSTATHEKVIEESNGIERVDHARAIKLEKEKTKKALDQAQYYRNLAEKLRREKRNAVNVMNNKIEVVRDFWRNKILEGSTRAGRMVREALNAT